MCGYTALTAYCADSVCSSVLLCRYECRAHCWVAEWEDCDEGEGGAGDAEEHKQPRYSISVISLAHTVCVE